MYFVIVLVLLKVSHVKFIFRFGVFCNSVSASEGITRKIFLRVGNNGCGKIGPYRYIVEQNSTAPTVVPSRMSNSIPNLIL